MSRAGRSGLGTAPDRIVAWMAADVPDRRYRFVRRGLAALVALRLLTGSFAELARQPDATFRPPGLIGWMHGFPPAPLLVATQVLGLVAAVAAASGWGVRAVETGGLRDGAQTAVVRVAYPLAWASYLVLAAVKTSGGKILHNDVLLLLVALPLVFVPENRVSGDPGATSRTRWPRHNVGWALNLALVVLALSYFLAGVAKMRHSGLEWVFSDNIRYVMYWGAQGHTPPWGLGWVASIPGNSAFFARLVAATTVVFELGAPVVLVWRRVRPWYAGLAVILHTATWITLGLDYWAWSLTALVVLIDWGQAEPRREVPGSAAVAGDDRARAEVVSSLAPDAARGVLVYDADRASCTRVARSAEHRGQGRVWAGPGQRLPLDELGLTEDQTAAEVWWIARDGSAHSGHRAVAMALWATGGVWVVPARALLLPGAGLVAGPAYRLVARNRHRLPGGDEARAIDAGATGPAED